jgi:hypothetical protein
MAVELVIGGLIRDRLPQLRIYLRHLRRLEAGGHQLRWVFVMDNCSPATHELVAGAFPEAQRIRVDDGGPAYTRQSVHRPFGRMAALRNRLRDAALEPGIDGLVSIDSDIVVVPDLIMHLLAPGRPWVAALVDNSRGSRTAYNVMAMHPEPPHRIWRFTLDHEHGGPADLIGAACFYHRDLLERAVFAYDYRGEDVGFARHAQAAGIRGWYIPLELEHLMTDAQTERHRASCGLCREGGTF